MKKILLLPGDGIGPEVIDACLPLLKEAASIGGYEFSYEQGLIGWAAYDVYKDVMPKETWELCKQADIILLGAVGLPNRDKELHKDLRPERRALLPLRKVFALGCNIRPIAIYPELADISPLKNERLKNGVNLTFFRELIGGDYFGKRREDTEGNWAEDICRYDRHLIESIARAAFKRAQVTGESVTSIDKANVLGATGTFWRKIVQEVHDAEFPDVKLEHQYVDVFNLYLFTKPEKFQIVLCSNAHGDILSDGAAGLAGSMGLLPSASLNLETGFGLYEQAGGSAPDIAGKGIVNPIATILSIALMFRYSLNDNETAIKIEIATRKALQQGWRTADLKGTAGRPVGTTEMVEKVVSNLQEK